MMWVFSANGPYGSILGAYTRAQTDKYYTNAMRLAVKLGFGLVLAV